MVTHHSRTSSKGLGGLATGLFIAGAGLGLINRGATRPREFWSYFAVSAAIAALLVFAIR
jgi:type III secretory pathway component EscT